MNTKVRIKMLSTNINTNQNDIKMIVDSLNKKSKSTFKYHQKELIKQASYFSPLYRDFINKIINSNHLKITHTYDGGYITPDEQMFETEKLRKKQKNRIVTDITEVDTLPHELGHAVDFWFGQRQALTSSVILSSGKTLQEIFDEEFELNYQQIYQEMMDEYKLIINSNINDQAFDILLKYVPLYNELEYAKTPKKRKKIHEELYKSGFVEVYYQLYNRNCYKMLNHKYCPVLDALSSKYNFDGLFLDHHELFYYKINEKRPVQEFFANCFGAKVTPTVFQIDNVIKYLPESYKAFEELFSIFYNHFQNNKRFTDLTIKRREIVDYEGDEDEL